MIPSTIFSEQSFLEDSSSVHWYADKAKRKRYRSKTDPNTKTNAKPKTKTKTKTKAKYRPPRSVSYTLVLPHEIACWLDARAEVLGIPRKRFARDILTMYVHLVGQEEKRRGWEVTTPTIRAFPQTPIGYDRILVPPSPRNPSHFDDSPLYGEDQ